MNIVEIKNLNYSYKDKEIFENLNINIKKNTITTILGSNGSGKSTLARLINKKYRNIKINTTKINYVYSNPDEQIVENTVKEQLMFYLKQTNIDNTIINNKIKKIIREFKLAEVIDNDPYQLNNEQKQLIVLLSNTLIHPELLILDDALSFVGTYYKNKVLRYLKRQKISIINFTNDTEECMYSNYIVIINKKVVLNKTLKKALKEEKIFIENNLKLPFIAELSLKLNYYKLLDDTVLNIEEMVNKLWN